MGETSIPVQRRPLCRSPLWIAAPVAFASLKTGLGAAARGAAPARDSRRYGRAGRSIGRTFTPEVLGLAAHAADLGAEVSGQCCLDALVHGPHLLVGQGVIGRLVGQ